jgi:hypothetical protein
MIKRWVEITMITQMINPLSMIQIFNQEGHEPVKNNSQDKFLLDMSNQGNMELICQPSDSQCPPFIESSKRREMPEDHTRLSSFTLPYHATTT